MSYRSYEVYQRERVGETTNLVNPRDLIGNTYLADPFTVPGVMRENYPCYRDWVGNRFWLTRYDDVTSVFVDDANFASRSRLSAYDGLIAGTDLGELPIVRQVVADHIDALIDEIRNGGITIDGHDLVAGFAAPLSTRLLARVLGVDDHTGGEIGSLVSALQRGASWLDTERIRGVEASAALVRRLEHELHRQPDGDRATVVGAATELDASAADLAVTLLELDHVTLPASLVNLWCLLLTHAGEFERVRAEPRLMKFAYLEALRHSPPILTADRFARHEVERFGRLLPEGALLHLSAAAANRDPLQFDDPDRFDVTRKDLCQREPRGQYRADGLPSGITFGHGKPSKLPAVPRDAPRSSYALTRDLAVAASSALLERYPSLRLAPGEQPLMTAEYLGAPYTCAELLVIS